MTFLESRLDKRITQGATRKVTQPSRTKVYGSSGRLKQNFMASLPIHRYELSHGMMAATTGVARAYTTVMDLFYLVMFTPYSGFRLKDHADFKATADNSSVTALGAGVYQLNRLHTYGGQNLHRPIYKPVSSTVAVFAAGGGALTPTVDYTNGTFTVLSGTPAYWTGEFDIPVTFVDDEWMATLEANEVGLQVVMGQIELEEVRL
jgi:uncharacterized protein (TIGR02217 family)